MDSVTASRRYVNCTEEGVVKPTAVNVGNETVTLLATTVLQPSLNKSGQSIPLSLLQWTVFLLGTLGNLLVLVVLIWRRNSAHHFVMQLFIGYLCVTNMVLMFGVAWVQAVLYTNQEWKFGIVWCKMYFFFTGLTLGCSTWTMAAIAVMRCVGLQKLKYAVSAITLISTSMAITNAPYAVWGEILYSPKYRTISCMTGKTLDPTTLSSYLIVGRTITYIIPLIMLWTAYIGLAYSMRSSLNKILPSNGNNGGASHGIAHVSAAAPGIATSSAGSRRVTLMCMAVASCFTLVSLPLCLDVLFVAAGDRTGAGLYSQQLTTLRTMNACIDPIVYGLMWRSFRKSIRQVS